MKLEITKERVLAAADKCGDAKNILKELFPEIFGGGIKIGQRFVGGYGTYILSQTGSKKVNLISLSDGNRYTEGIPVNKVHNITDEEFREICGGDKFTKV